VVSCNQNENTDHKVDDLAPHWVNEIVVVTKQ
jgi:hypothetical protein